MPRQAYHNPNGRNNDDNCAVLGDDGQHTSRRLAKFRVTVFAVDELLEVLRNAPAKSALTPKTLQMAQQKIVTPNISLHPCRPLCRSPNCRNDSDDSCLTTAHRDEASLTEPCNRSEHLCYPEFSRHAAPPAKLVCRTGPYWLYSLVLFQPSSDARLRHMLRGLRHSVLSQPLLHASESKRSRRGKSVGRRHNRSDAIRSSVAAPVAALSPKHRVRKESNIVMLHLCCCSTRLVSLSLIAGLLSRSLVTSFYAARSFYQAQGEPQSCLQARSWETFLLANLPGKGPEASATSPSGSLTQGQHMPKQPSEQAFPMTNCTSGPKQVSVVLGI